MGALVDHLRHCTNLRSSRPPPVEGTPCGCPRGAPPTLHSTYRHRGRPPYGHPLVGALVRHLRRCTALTPSRPPCRGTPCGCPRGAPPTIAPTYAIAAAPRTTILLVGALAGHLRHCTNVTSSAAGPRIGHSQFIGCPREHLRRCTELTPSQLTPRYWPPLHKMPLVDSLRSLHQLTPSRPPPVRPPFVGALVDTSDSCHQLERHRGRLPNVRSTPCGCPRRHHLRHCTQLTPSRKKSPRTTTPCGMPSWTLIRHPTNLRHLSPPPYGQTLVR